MASMPRRRLRRHLMHTRAWHLIAARHQSDLLTVIRSRRARGYSLRGAIASLAKELR